MSGQKRSCVCRRCLRVKTHAARGLCSTCYGWVLAKREQTDYERLARSRDEVLDEWLLLRADGYSIPAAAQRMGMTPKALDQVITRAKRAADPRALRAIA